MPRPSGKTLLPTLRPIEERYAKRIYGERKAKPLPAQPKTLPFDFEMERREGAQERVKNLGLTPAKARQLHNSVSKFAHFPAISPPHSAADIPAWFLRLENGIKRNMDFKESEYRWYKREANIGANDAQINFWNSLAAACRASITAEQDFVDWLCGLRPW